MNKNENAEKNPLCVYEDTQTQAKLRGFVCHICNKAMGVLLANKCDFCRDSLAEFNKMQKPDQP